MSSKIDCLNTVNFFKEKERLTKNCHISCLECPLNFRYNGKNIDCISLIMRHTEKAIEILQEWSDENPVKTRLEDFTEKYPNYLTETKDDTPTACCRHLGYIDKCPLIKCSECWNKSI